MVLVFVRLVVVFMGVEVSGEGKKKGLTSKYRSAPCNIGTCLQERDNIQCNLKQRLSWR